jgi:hypothetical protein
VISIDKSELDVLANTFKYLQKELNTNRHLNSVTKAAFDIMSSQFDKDTAENALMLPQTLHHVYEWGQIGNPAAQLWVNRLGGRGGSRTISWDWRASKTIVPTEVTPTGKPKFPPTFPVGKLQKVHVFVWKAPVMEYGTRVTVTPQLSPRKLLVFPDPNDLAGRGTFRSPKGVVFTPHSYTFIPGRQTAGNFQRWFLEWWAGGHAERILSQAYEPSRNNAFRRSFNQRIKSATSGAKRTKTTTFGIDIGAASRGKTIAQLIAGDLQRNYIEMARRRRR